MATVKAAYKNDDNPEMVYVAEADGLSALRHKGKWERFDDITVDDLEKYYRQIDDPAQVDKLIAEARKALGATA